MSALYNCCSSACTWLRQSHFFGTSNMTGSGSKTAYVAKRLSHALLPPGSSLSTKWFMGSSEMAAIPDRSSVCPTHVLNSLLGVEHSRPFTSILSPIRSKPSPSKKHQAYSHSAMKALIRIPKPPPSRSTSIYIYTYKHIHVHMYLSIYAHSIYMYALICIFIYVYMCVYVYVHLHAHTYIHKVMTPSCTPPHSLSGQGQCCQLLGWRPLGRSEVAEVPSASALIR